MNATEQIKFCLMNYTSIMAHPRDAVYHMMFVIGNGYEWNKKGELVTWDSDKKKEYEYSEYPLQAAQEKFVHDNIDLLMDDMSGIFGGPNILSHLTHVYHGHTRFETVPANVSNGWGEIVWQTFTDLERFVNRHSQNETYHKYQYDNAVKLIDSFKNTEYYNVVGLPRQKRMAEGIKAVLEKLREREK